MNKIKEWEIARNKLKVIYEDKGIMRCEICGGTFALSFHHKRKRIEYYSCPEKLGYFNETILVDAKCHDRIENNRELTAKLFKQLR